jgi:hypothetical protein
MQKIKINPFLKKKLDSSLHPDNPPVAEGFRLPAAPRVNDSKESWTGRFRMGDFSEK